MSVPHSCAHIALRVTGIVYVCLGFGISAWLSRSSDVRDDLGLTPTTIGTMLFIAPLDSLFILPTSGPIMTKIGMWALDRISVLIQALGIVCTGVGALNVSIPLAILGLTFLVAGNGLWGATMNIEAGLVQAATRHAIASIIQAMYAVDMPGGTPLGVLASRMGMPLGAHLFGLTVLKLSVCGTAVGLYLTKEEVAALTPTQDKGGGGEAVSNKVKSLTHVARREKQAVLIALMVMNAGLIEGVADNWLNLSIIDDYGYSTAAASAAFAFSLLMMMVMRLASPCLEARLGSLMLLRITFSSMAVGLLLVAFVPYYLFAAVGTALWSIEPALGFPLGIPTLSVDPVMAPTRVLVLSAANYGAALIGPPLLGPIADHIGCHRVLALVALPVLFAIVFAGQVPDRHGTKCTDLAFGN